MKKLISFESLDMYDSDDLKNKLYELFFSWSKDNIEHHDISNKGKKKMMSIYEEFSEIRNANHISVEEQEERRRRLQLKMD